MILSKATNRYARTFFKASLERGNLEEVVKDMRFIVKILVQTKSLEPFFNNPVVGREQVEKIFLDKIRGGIQPLTLEFFNLLIKKNRVHLFPEIPTAFIEHYETHRNILRASIKSVQKLSDDQLEKIREKLKEKTGAGDIQIKNIVDPKLIAGFQIKIGDTVIDANIKNKLSQLKRKLAA